MSFYDKLKFDANGLIPAIVQEQKSGRVVMMAWMNREALEATAKLKQAVYFSRSRNKLWHKGETSHHVQNVQEIRLDCDEDVIVLMVEQIGGIACHTGRESCFYRVYKEGEKQDERGGEWEVVEPVLKDPSEIY